MIWIIVGVLVLLGAVIFRKQVQSVVKVLLVALHSFADEYNSSYIENEEEESASNATGEHFAAQTDPSISQKTKKAN